MVNIAGGSGGIRVFETTDVQGTLSPLTPTGNDPSDVTFLDDQTRVVVAISWLAEAGPSYVAVQP